MATRRDVTTVLVLMGGPDAERAVSLDSGRAVADALGADPRWHVAARTIDRPDAVELSAMIEETDRSVGAIVDKLDALGLREKTLVLFISDNGGLDKYTSQRPLRGDKCTLYEGGIRVPMIASMPGRIAAGKTSEEPVSGIDFYPTICRFMSVEPTDPAKVDGEDLNGVLFEGKTLGERNLFWNWPSYNRPEDPARCPRSGATIREWPTG